MSLKEVSILDFEERRWCLSLPHSLISSLHCHLLTPSCGEWKRKAKGKSGSAILRAGDEKAA